MKESSLEKCLLDLLEPGVYKTTEQGAGVPDGVPSTVAGAGGGGKTPLWRHLLSTAALHQDHAGSFCPPPGELPPPPAGKQVHLERSIH